MNERLLEPLKYYETEGKATHEKNVNEYFDDLVTKSGINVEENHATVKKYKKENDILTGMDKKLSRYKTAKVFLIIGIVLGAILTLISFVSFASSVSTGAILLAIGVIMLVLCIVFLIKKVNPLIKKTGEILEVQRKKVNEILNEAYRQMAPLNDLFDERDTITLMETTLPEINFEDSFSKEQEELFIKHYDFIDLESEECSMTKLLSGKFEGNPFLFCQCLMHELKSQTYHGTLLISWTETYRDNEGKTRTRRRTQTLYASVTKPKPFYHYNNYLAYGSQAAPDLTFSRAPQVKANMDEKDIEKKVRKGEKELKKKAEKAISNGGTFQEMANAEFDVLFGAANRNNEVQFRLMYTPLAQRNTVELIKSKTGYGDDFYFTKQNRFNIITTDHAQNWNMDTSPDIYTSYDVDEARRKFLEHNMAFFKTVFFDFAPILSVPAYLESPCKSLEKPDTYVSNYPYYEHEAMANAFDKAHFLPERGIGEGILKTQLIEKSGNTDHVAVIGYGYEAYDRVDFVPTLGGDGRIHGVPVHWTEYIPVQRTRNVEITSTEMSKKEYHSKNGDILDQVSQYLRGMIGKITN